MLKHTSLTCLLISFATLVNAKADSLPPEIMKLRQESFAACREAGGKPSADNKYLQAADFNGDGRPDYVVDDERLNCDGFPSLWCGSGGCSIEL